MIKANPQFYNNVSRYYGNIDLIKVNINDVNKTFPLMLDNIKFKDQDIKYFYTVDQSEEGRIDLIANKVYGNTRLWWAIAIANLIEDLLDNPKAGDVLKIPSLTALEQYL